MRGGERGTDRAEGGETGWGWTKRGGGGAGGKEGGGATGHKFSQAYSLIPVRQNI